MILTKEFLEIKYPNLEIEEINLEYSNITEIEKDAFSSFKNLKELYLNNNQITKIEGLENLINLKTLYLDNNQITKIVRLKNLIKLKNLYIYNNKLNKKYLIFFSKFFISDIEYYEHEDYEDEKFFFKNKNKHSYLIYNKII